VSAARKYGINVVHEPIHEEKGFFFSNGNELRDWHADRHGHNGDSLSNTDIGRQNEIYRADVSIFRFRRQPINYIDLECTSVQPNNSSGGFPIVYERNRLEAIPTESGCGAKSFGSCPISAKTHARSLFIRAHTVLPLLRFYSFSHSQRTCLGGRSETTKRRNTCCGSRCLLKNL
jgi:hypothetical protein